MPWLYQISSGRLSDPFGRLRPERGYSGHGLCRNDPHAIGWPNNGPIPIGQYRIGKPSASPQHGPLALPLTAVGDTYTFGRFGFMIHGDNLTHPGDASCGCIVLPHSARLDIAGSNDEQLTVIA